MIPAQRQSPDTSVTMQKGATGCPGLSTYTLHRCQQMTIASSLNEILQRLRQM